MAISFADQTIPERLLEGQTQTRRLRGGVRIRVTSGLVWLTIAGCRQDIWLTAGRCFDYHGRGLAILEAMHGAAEFTVSPLRVAGWRSDSADLAAPDNAAAWLADEEPDDAAD
jgi:hypothetical protein